MSTINLWNGFLTCSEHDPAGWCVHLEDYIKAQLDAVWFAPGARINVPMIPTRGVFAPIHISSATIGDSALMTLEYAPDVGRPFSIGLGFWNPGEGSWIVRSVIIDYMKFKLHPDEKLGAGEFKARCPSNTHGIPEMRLMEEKCNDPLWKWNCLWNMVMEKACTPCVEQTQGAPDDNFGVDPSLARSRPAPGGRSDA